LIALVVVLQLVQSLASLYLPTLNAVIIDSGVAKGDYGVIWSYGAAMLGVAIVQICAQIGAAWCGARAAMSFGRDVRGAIFNKSLTFSSREVARFGAPSLITRNTNDVQQVQVLALLTATLIVSAPLTMIGGCYMALREDVGLSWLILVAILALGVLIGIFVTQVHPLFKTMQTRVDGINRVLREQISGLRVIRAFVREPTEGRRFNKANHELADTAISVGVRMMTMFPLVFLIINCSQVAVMWFGAGRIAGGDLQVGQLTAYIAYLVQILMSVMMATMMLMIGPRAAVSSERINEVLDAKISVVPPADPTELPALNDSSSPAVAFEEVAFRYPGAEKPVVHGLTFTARRGQVTGIIGSTGSGKTTLINLIPRLFDATEGTVRIDGVDVRDAEPLAMWARIGFVPQKPYLFSGTIASNLKMGKVDATEAEMWAALRVAQAADFVEKMPEQLDAPIAQGGTNVSGGQRQRLAIARALIRHPEIYVFDDAFSALDVATDAALRKALAAETHDAAVIIVAQRISTIRHADQIIVLDDGTIEAIGTHEQLLEASETYREIVESQFAAEEGVNHG
jgi:ATP-binding cassette subfamily B protein